MQPSPTADHSCPDDPLRRDVTLELAELETRAPHVTVTAAPSLFAIAADIAGAGRGVPDCWVEAARSRLEPVDLRALAPIGLPAGERMPGCAALMGEQDRAMTAAEAIEWIATLPPEVLLEDLEYARGPDPGPPWDAVARDPRRWLVLYARALLRTWDGMREIWTSAEALVEREAERLQTASERRALPELLTTAVDAGARVSEGVFRLPSLTGGQLQIPLGGFKLTPVLGGPRSARAQVGEGTLLALHYPPPGIASMLTGAALPPAAALDSLLGPARAMILRLLDRPTTAGTIAQSIYATPPAATHHLKALEAAGLVARERTGRHVLVHRTSRGDGLLHLYFDD